MSLDLHARIFLMDLAANTILQFRVAVFAHTGQSCTRMVRIVHRVGSVRPGKVPFGDRIALFCVQLPHGLTAWPLPCSALGLPPN